ncbi:hypothetical protein RRF57_004532 [Xylaria bambusicola]|uniref:Uncharacterized protein n=1 Tax=Xylaria bambusicola TaxID=326684 RepID=A0AAN7Z3Y7_9PEZI
MPNPADGLATAYFIPTRAGAYGEGMDQRALRPSSLRHRRISRPSTDFSHAIFEKFEKFDARPEWRPGSEPGTDTSKPDGGHVSVAKLRASCQITIVDFSEDNIVIHELDNDGLIEFRKTLKPGWAECRWINVNGLSWDVIQTQTV